MQANYDMFGLGLGVDDMFVIIEAWNNLSPSEKQKDLAEKVAMTMKHAGVSITVTSVTDFVAFAIGATTVSPASLRSYPLQCYQMGTQLYKTVIIIAVLAPDCWYWIRA